MAYNEDSSASGHDEPWIQWYADGRAKNAAEYLKRFSCLFPEDVVVSHHLFHFVYNRFCGLKGHEMFCEVERSYIEDGFNLYGLRTCVSNFSDCLDLILDRIGPDDSDDSHLTQSACTLYGLIHARYIITAHGLDAMYNKVRLHFRPTVHRPASGFLERCCAGLSPLFLFNNFLRYSMLQRNLERVH
jgi:Casein kinase II regulatory subunit